MSPPECGECTPFVERVLRAYEPLLTQYGFKFADCTSERGGRECAAMYTSPEAKLLFVLTDGALATAISDRDTPFPPGGWSGGDDGEAGWYSVVGLIEYIDGKKLMTRKLMDEVARGKRDYFTWEAGLTNAAMGRLLGLFTPDNQRSWQSDFANYARTRRYG
jgi:hypothetical protein